jgi:hypothetical protein
MAPAADGRSQAGQVEDTGKWSDGGARHPLPVQAAPVIGSTPEAVPRVIVLPDSVMTPEVRPAASRDARLDAEPPSLSAPVASDTPPVLSPNTSLIGTRLRLAQRIATRDPLDYDRRAVDLARNLLPLTEDLPSTSGAAGAVLTRAMSVTGSDAGAVLLSDGLDWRVSAGAGLRPLEWRLQLPETHWVIETVARDNRVLIVDGTDAVRGRLSPMPLSSRSHLMVAPLGRAPGLIVLARDQAFEPTDIESLANIPVSAFDHVADSLHVRALARALDALRDLP